MLFKWHIILHTLFKLNSMLSVTEISFWKIHFFFGEIENKLTVLVVVFNNNNYISRLVWIMILFELSGVYYSGLRLHLYYKLNQFYIVYERNILRLCQQISDISQIISNINLKDCKDHFTRVIKFLFLRLIIIHIHFI